MSFKHTVQPPLNIKLHMDNFKVEFRLFSTSFLWDHCNWRSHCKVVICNFIHRGGRIIVYRALTTPEPLCCGTPLVYHVLCKIKKELDPKRSPLRCNQNQQSAAKAWQNVSQEYITNTVAERGWALGESQTESKWNFTKQQTLKDLYGD